MAEPKPSQRGMSRFLFGLAGIASALLAWQLLSGRVASSLILPRPAEVLKSLALLLQSGNFWKAVLGTLTRVVWAFLLSLAFGSLTGVLSGLSPGLRDFLSPMLTTIRATPVLALILLVMFWLPAKNVPIFSAFLMAYPVVHTSMYSGIVSVDKDLLEMASVFKVPASVTFFRLRLPALQGHFVSGAKNALGLCWKVVVAGEVLSQPAFALGTGMQDARLSLETSSVFAWAITTVALCGTSEYILGLAAKRLQKRAEGNEQ